MSSMATTICRCMSAKATTSNAESRHIFPAIIASPKRCASRSKSAVSNAGRPPGRLAHCCSKPNWSSAWHRHTIVCCTGRRCYTRGNGRTMRSGRCWYRARPSILHTRLGYMAHLPPSSKPGRHCAGWPTHISFATLCWGWKKRTAQTAVPAIGSSAVRAVAWVRKHQPRIHSEQSRRWIRCA